MNVSRASFSFTALALVTLAGCGVRQEDVSVVQETSQSLHSGRYSGLSERPPPNGANGLRPSCFWALGAQQALRTLGGAALDRGGGYLTSISLSQVSDSCREVLRDVIQCALTVDQAVTDPVTQEVYTGWWGLAPSWLTGALDTDGRRYVTACMIQRLNFSGTSVPILLEGPHPAIALNATYSPMYPISESTAFGDLFSSTTPLDGLLPAFNVYVCWESLLPQACGSLGLPLLFEHRICDDAPLCGLTTLGPCATSCAANGPYWKCKQNLLAPWWTQTVRVKLETETCE